MPNWLLRDYAPWLCEPLCAIFSANVREGNVPFMFPFITFLFYFNHCRLVDFHLFIHGLMNLVRGSVGAIGYMFKKYYAF